MENKVQNKINAGQIVTIDLEEYYPKEQQHIIDLKDNLWQELVLKEKDFREFVKNNNWSFYQDTYVGVYCSADVIIPVWAYMLVAANVAKHAKRVYFGDKTALNKKIFTEIAENLDTKDLSGKRVIIKGCGKLDIPSDAFVAITQLLQPIARSISYGEACSSVPVFKSTLSN